MKRYFHLIFGLLAGLLLSGCGGDGTADFDSLLLPGYWVTDSQVNHVADAEYWYLASDGTGYTWDTSDDVTESEAQPFTWNIVGATLTFVHKGLMGEDIPKQYTVRTLTATKLVFYDKFDVSRTFTKTTQP